MKFFKNLIAELGKLDQALEAKGFFTIKPYLYLKFSGKLEVEKEFELANVPIAGLSVSVGAATVGSVVFALA